MSRHDVERPADHAADPGRPPRVDRSRGGPADGTEPESPAELPKRSWWGVLKRTVKEFQQDNLTDWAAALTYYAVLSIFPALLAVVSLLGLFGRSATQPLVDNLGALAPGPARQTVETVLQTLQSSQRAAGLAAVMSIAVALWSASGYVGAFIRAANVMYEMPEGRPIWKTLPLRLAITTVLVILTAAGAVAVVFTGGLAEQAGRLLGVGQTAVTVWGIVKWPVLVVAVMLVLALLYWASPNVEHPGFRWLTPGSALAVVLWILASAAFGFYVANFSSYSKTYAALAGVIVFLVWLWISNVAVLLGVEFDAELARERAIEKGHPEDVEPYVEPRDTRKFDEQEARRAGL
ncbi:membrane protein [Streptosporangium becharense]|uniref:Membrane protein n=1 Tax=Streptosporangium becharense TaxID=1816182 RepID=A0A7W9IHP4_9ACTN|nr:YihY/virulence factor BrkB family protein [Streptosporangium becharense]MBB2914660.1 membrane protein [Streptosporangium becharense]MBB5820939.1 membrane protein [Streptosporangium becharense]